MGAGGVRVEGCDEETTTTMSWLLGCLGFLGSELGCGIGYLDVFIRSLKTERRLGDLESWCVMCKARMIRERTRIRANRYVFISRKSHGKDFEDDEHYTPVWRRLSMYGVD